MKTQKNTLVVFLLIISVIFTYFSPLVFAAEGPGNQNESGQGDSSGAHHQGSPNATGQMGGPGRNQTGGQNQSGPGYGNGNNTAGAQHRYQYQRQYMNINGTGNCTRVRSQY